MTAKRFRVNELVKYNYSEIGEYIDENHTDRPLRNDILVELLNELHEENEQLKTQLQNTSDQRDEFHRGARENANRVGKLEKENGQLRHDATILVQSNQDYRKENEELKQRNDRQAKRLAELYELMAKKDWESLTEIIDDFCSCEEQLQREWRTYK